MPESVRGKFWHTFTMDAFSISFISLYFHVFSKWRSNNPSLYSPFVGGMPWVPWINARLTFKRCGCCNVASKLVAMERCGGAPGLGRGGVA